nr:hypothetical protein [Tanacetum cinerariifolium]
MIAILEKTEHNVDFHWIVDFIEASHIRRATRIAQSKALPTATDEPASLLRDDRQGEALPTVSGFEARQDRENIIKTSALPHDSTPRVTSLDADDGTANILTSRVAAVSVPPVAGVPTVGVPTASRLFPTEKMVESDTPKKKKLQKEIDVQVARETEEEMAREDQRMNEQIARNAEIAKIHAEEELQKMIDGLDRNNEVIAKHLQEFEQAADDLTTGEMIELINELVKYQDHHAKILKGMTLEEIKEKFIPIWKQVEDFVPMSSKEESERFKRKGLRLEQENAKRMKTSEDVSEEDIKEMMQLVHVEEDIGEPSINPLLLPKDVSMLLETYSSYQDAGVGIQTALLVMLWFELIIHHHIVEFNHAFLNFLSNEMVSNVNVLGPGVLDIIAAKSNGTTIITIQENLVEVKAVVSDQFITKELSTFGHTSSCVMTSCMICICIGQQILTEYHSTPEEPVLTCTKPSLDDKHMSGGLDQ